VPHRRPLPPAPSRRPLRGRDDELGAITDLLLALGRGTGGVCALEASRGAGTTRLIAEVRAIARRLGVATLGAKAYPGGDQVPFGLLLDALLSGGEPLAPGSGDSVAAAFAARLEAATPEAPVLVAIDDFPSGDEASRAGCARLVAALAGRPVLWLLAGAPSPARRPDWDALAGGATARLRLAPLAPADVLAVAQDVLGAPPAPALGEALAVAGGWPRALVDLLEGLRADGAIAVRDGEAVLLHDRLPLAFGHAVQEQLEELGPGGRDVVLAASAFGGRCTRAQLTAVLEAPAGIAATVATACASGLLACAGEGAVALAHPRLAEVVDATVPMAYLRSLQRRVLRVRLAEGAEPRDVAELVLRVAEAGDHEAVGLLRRAAAARSAQDSGEAARWSRRALELAQPKAPDRAALIAETATLLWQAGEHDDARAVAERAWGGALLAEEEAAIRLVLARLAAERGEAGATAMADLALGLDDLTPETRAALLVVRAQSLLAGDDVPALERGALAARDVAQLAGDAVAGASALRILALAESRRGQFERALERLDAVAAATADGVEEPWGAVLQAAAGRLDAALEATAAGALAARRRGRPLVAGRWRMARTRVLLDAGRLAEAQAEGRAALAGPDGDGLWAQLALRPALGRVARHTGDRPGLRAAAAWAAEQQGSEHAQVRLAGAWLAVLGADAAGDRYGALAAAEPLLALLRRDGVLALAPADLPLLARVALRGGDGRGAALARDAAARLADAAPGLPLLAAVAEHVRGLVDADLPALERAVAAPGAAAAQPLAAAAATEDLARALARRGEGDAATGHLDAALRGWEGAGATWDAARVRNRLRELGVRRGRTMAVVGASGWAGLTPAEVAVVRLVAEGVTNRQVADALFVSPHTVSSHLRHAYAKLGIRSRMALVRLVDDADERTVAA